LTENDLIVHFGEQGVLVTKAELGLIRWWIETKHVGHFDRLFAGISKHELDRHFELSPAAFGHLVRWCIQGANRLFEAGMKSEDYTFYIHTEIFVLRSSHKYCPLMCMPVFVRLRKGKCKVAIDDRLGDDHVALTFLRSARATAATGGALRAGAGRRRSRAGRGRRGTGCGGGRGERRGERRRGRGARGGRAGRARAGRLAFLGLSMPALSLSFGLLGFVAVLARALAAALAFHR